jgi:asparagine synthase (glutamine-hydrolysing)
MPVQGESPFQQPVVSDNGVLLLSGELWEHEGRRSDTRYLLDVLTGCSDLAPAIGELRGMFAFVYYCARRGEVYFASDVFGEVPLYFHHSDQNLLVASEIKQLVALGVPLKRIDPAQPGVLYSYATADSTLEAIEYHTWEFENDSTDLEEELIVERLRASTRQKYETIDLQRSALLLSGGLDSAILAYELRKLGLKDTFTVAAREDAKDLHVSRAVCERFGLNFNPVVVEELRPECAVAVTEVSNRSIVEEMCCHLVLSNVLSALDIRVVFAGCGADEIFVGYQHLLRYRNQETRRRLQEEFVTKYHGMDLRAFNKAYMLNAIEVRNPYLSPDLLNYVATLDVDSLLIGQRREMKRALRLAYAEHLGDLAKQPKLIARETMGAKQRLRETHGNSPYVYRRLKKDIFSDPERILSLLGEAQTLQWSRPG